MMPTFVIELIFVCILVIFIPLLPMGISNEEGKTYIREFIFKKFDAGDDCKNELQLNIDVTDFLSNRPGYNRMDARACFLTCVYNKIGWIRNKNINLEMIEKFINNFYQSRYSRSRALGKFSRRPLRVLERCIDGVKRHNLIHDCDLGPLLRMCVNEDVLFFHSEK